MKQYKWDNERGIIQIDTFGDWTQAIQLVGGSRKFRSMCGKLLVEKLNLAERGKAYQRSNKALRLTRPCRASSGSAPFCCANLGSEKGKANEN